MRLKNSNKEIIGGVLRARMVGHKEWQTFRPLPNEPRMWGAYSTNLLHPHTVHRAEDLAALINETGMEVDDTSAEFAVDVAPMKNGITFPDELESLLYVGQASIYDGNGDLRWRVHDTKGEWMLEDANGVVVAVGGAGMVSEAIARRWYKGFEVDMSKAASWGRKPAPGEVEEMFAADMSLAPAPDTPGVLSTELKPMTLAQAHKLTMELGVDIGRTEDEARAAGILPLSRVDRELIAQMDFGPVSLAIEAERIVNGARAQDYGDAKDNFERIRDILRVAFGHDLTTRQIIDVMKAVKLARNLNRKKRDNPVDLIGYFLLDEKLHPEDFQ